MADHLRRAGYATHQTGKWNAGSLLYGQVPTERGFMSSLGYMSGACGVLLVVLAAVLLVVLLVLLAVVRC